MDLEAKLPQTTFALLWGPSFTTAETAPDICEVGEGPSVNSSLQLLDVYPLLCWALNLPRPWLHWGHLSRVTRLLRDPPSGYDVEKFEKRTAVWKSYGVGERVSESTLIAGWFIVWRIFLTKKNIFFLTLYFFSS